MATEIEHQLANMKIFVHMTSDLKQKWVRVACGAKYLLHSPPLVTEILG